MRRRGFTLIELLVAVAVVGLMASIVIVSLNIARTKARNAANQQLDANFNHNLGDALIAQYIFDDGALTDSSGSGNAGVVSGTLAYSADTPFGAGQALSLLGNGFVRINNSASLNFGSLLTNITISLWFKSAPCGSSHCGLFGTSSSGCGYDREIWLTADGRLCQHVYTALNDEIACTSSGKSYADNRWHFVLLTLRQNSGNYLYVDGSQRSYGSNGSSEFTWASRAAVGSTACETRNFTGLIENVRIYDRALETAEIQKLYAEEAPKHGLAVK